MVLVTGKQYPSKAISHPTNNQLSFAPHFPEIGQQEFGLDAHGSQVRQQLRKTGTGAPWTGSVLARAEQERRLALLAREAVAQHVRDGALGASSTGETVPSSGLPSLKAPWKSSEMHVHLCCVFFNDMTLNEI